MATPSPPTNPPWPYPLTREQFKALNEALYAKLVEEDCDRTVRHTQALLEEQGLPMEALAWLQREGGLCDCELYMNVTRCIASW